MATKTQRIEFTDLGDPIMFSNPYPRYAELRRSCPVSRVRVPMVRKKGYMLTRFDDVVALHGDPRFSSDMMRHGPMRHMRWFLPKSAQLLTDSMVFKDDPDHRRLRRLVHKAFTPKLVAGMAGDITCIARELTDQLESAGEIDLVRDYAVPFPLAVIARLLGVNDQDRDEFHELCLRVTQSIAAGPRRMIRLVRSVRKLSDLFERLADERRLDPDDNLVSQLVRATHEGDKLSDHEALAMIFLLLLAGHDTTSNLIGNSVLALLDHPLQLARLRADPTLIDTGVEELLRFTAPVPVGTARVALEDVEIGGTRIPRGSAVYGMLISANRDETVFTNPDELDLSRTPNGHVAFAFGTHHCLGHHLARLEARIALTELLQRFDNMEITVPRESLQLRHLVSLRGFESLPMRVS